jgi:hypothetical protein
VVTDRPGLRDALMLSVQPPTSSDDNARNSAMNEVACCVLPTSRIVRRDPSPTAMNSANALLDGE